MRGAASTLELSRLNAEEERPLNRRRFYSFNFADQQGGQDTETDAETEGSQSSTRRRTFYRRRSSMAFADEGFIPQVKDDTHEDVASEDDDKNAPLFAMNKIGVDIVTGMLCFLMSTVVYVSIGDSIFHATGHGNAYIGIGMCVMPSAVLGWLLTVMTSVPWTSPSVDVTFTPIFAEMGEALIDYFKAHGVPDEQLLPTFVAGICLGYVAVGLALVTIGCAKISSLTNFIPAQVVAGFLAGTGVQLLHKSIKMAGHVSSLSELTVEKLVLLVPAAVLLMGLRLAHWSTRIPTAASVPLLLGGSTLVFHVWRLSLGMSFSEVEAQGWVFDWSADVVRETPHSWTWSLFGGLGWPGQVHWSAVVEACLPYMMTAIVIGVLKLAIKAGAFSLIFLREIDADAELIKLGIINTACGLLGASGIHWSFSNTSLAHELRSSTKGCGLFQAVFFVVLWSTGIAPLQHIPVFVYAALLADVGSGFIDSHFVKPLKLYGTSDAATLVAVVTVFIGVGMLAGIAIGIILSLVLLVVQLHDFGSVRFEASGQLVRSSSERDGRANAILSTHGGCTHLLRLQGYMFFATGADVLSCVERRLLQPEAPPLVNLVLDLSLVPAMDITAVRHFDKLRMLADGTHPLSPKNSAGFFVYLCSVRPDVKSILRPHCLKPSNPSTVRLGGGEPIVAFYDSIDEGLESAEDRCIGLHRPPKTTFDNSLSSAKRTSASMRPRSEDTTALWKSFLKAQNEGRRLSKDEEASQRAHLMPVALHLSVVELHSSEMLFRQRDPARCVFFVVSGEIVLEEDRHPDDSPWQSSRRLHIDDEVPRVRVRKVSRGCMLSSSDLHLGNAFNSYTATALCDTLVLSLAYDAILAMENNAPRSAMGVHKLIGYSLANKNSQSKRQIQQLTDLFS